MCNEDGNGNICFAAHRPRISLPASPGVASVCVYVLPANRFVFHGILAGGRGVPCNGILAIVRE